MPFLKGAKGSHVCESLKYAEEFACFPAVCNVSAGKWRERKHNRDFFWQVRKNKKTLLRVCRILVSGCYYASSALSFIICVFL